MAHKSLKVVMQQINVLMATCTVFVVLEVRGLYNNYVIIHFQFFNGI